jgi:hypothetical protein
MKLIIFKMCPASSYISTPSSLISLELTFKYRPSAVCIKLICHGVMNFRFSNKDDL